MDDQEDLEMERAAQLQQQRRAGASAQISETQRGGEDQKQRISTLEFGLMIGLMLVFFDLPQALFAATFMGVVVSLMIGFMGYLTLYIWLKIKGRSLFDAKSGSKRLFTFFGSAVVDTASGGFLPGLVGCVFGMMIIERLEEKLEKSGAAGALAKKII